MTCHDTDIKELLPLYAEEALDGAGKKEIEVHLAVCADCRSELALLRALAAEPVPDPGQAFWNSMPGRVMRAVQEQQTKGNGLNLSWLQFPIHLPRWTLGTTALAAVLLAAWWVVSPFRHGESPVFQEVYDLGYASLHDPVLTHPSTNMTDLSDPQLESVNSWAGRELKAIASEEESMIPVTDREVYDELADMNGPEIDKLSTMLNDYSEEG